MPRKSKNHWITGSLWSQEIRHPWIRNSQIMNMGNSQWLDLEARSGWTTRKRSQIQTHSKLQRKICLTTCKDPIQTVLGNQVKQRVLNKQNINNSSSSNWAPIITRMRQTLRKILGQEDSTIETKVISQCQLIKFTRMWKVWEIQRTISLPSIKDQWPWALLVCSKPNPQMDPQTNKLYHL